MRFAGVVTIVAAIGIVACSRDSEQRPPEYDNAALPGQPVPARFAPADFAHLRYLEGTWRGTMPNGNAFFESYHFIDDSTINKANHTDSTFRTKSDSSMIVYRGGAVIDSSGTSSYLAERLDSTTVDFRASPDYHFTWTRESNDAWTARLFRRNADGSDQVTIYPMKRVRAASPRP